MKTKFKLLIGFIKESLPESDYTYIHKTLILRYMMMLGLIIISLGYTFMITLPAILLSPFDLIFKLEEYLKKRLLRGKIRKIINDYYEEYKTRFKIKLSNISYRF